MTKITKTKPEYITWVILVGLSLLIILLEYIKVTDPLWTIAQYPINPVKRMLWSQSQQIQQQFQWITYWQSSQQELQQLRRGYQEQSELASQIYKLNQENQQLRKLLGATLPGDWKFLPVDIIGQQGDQLLINHGKNHNLTTGMIVILPPVQNSNLGILVGKIISVQPYQSKVLSISSTKTNIPVRIIQKNTNNEVGEGLLVFKNNNFLVEKLLPDDKIQPGDVVATKGDSFDLQTSTGWLGDVPIGVIIDVSFEQETDIYQQASVEWLGTGEKLTNAFVVIGW